MMGSCCRGKERDARPGASTGSGGQMRPGTLAAGVARARTMMKKKKKKKGRRLKGLFGRRPEERRGFIPVAPAVARQRDLDVNHARNALQCTIYVCVGFCLRRKFLKLIPRDGFLLLLESRG